MEVKVNDGMLIRQREDSIGLSFDPSLYRFHVEYDEDGKPISSDAEEQKKKKKKRWAGDQTLDDNHNNATKSSTLKKASTPMTWMTVAVCSISVGGFFFGGWAAIRGFSDMARRVVLRYIMPAISGAHAVVGGPVVLYQRRNIQNDLSLADVVAELKNQEDRLRRENEKLKENIHFIQQDVERLREVSNVLNEMCETQNTTIAYLNDNVREFTKINAELLEVVKARTWQEVTSIVLESDKNHDFTLEKREIEGLLLRLQFVETLNINEDLLRMELRNNKGSLRKFMKIVREALEKGSKPNSMIQVKPIEIILEEIKSSRSTFAHANSVYQKNKAINARLGNAM